MIIREITLINQKVLECLHENDETVLLKKFTKLATRVIGSDYGFAWLNSASSKKLELVYKSPNTPFEPGKPKPGGRNYNAIKSFKPEYVSYITKRKNRPDINSFIKSFVVIPLVYKNTIYGTLVLCFKRREMFSPEKKVLCVYIGSSIAQAITISRLNEKEISSLRNKAEHDAFVKEEQLKTEFIANAAHEIRTPLAIIRGNVDLAMMDKKSISGQVARTFLAINHEVEHLSEMLSDFSILTSRQTSVKENIVFRKIDIGNILVGAAKRCRVLANNKDIKIHIKKNLSALMVADSIYIKKVFLNLIRNAVNYGKKGGWIKVSIQKSKGKIIVKVCDNGIGISKSDLPYIFNRFYRVDKSHTREGGSTGLGLAIVKWIIVAHKGAIDVKSTLGKGSEFTVSFPKLKLD